MAQPDHYVQTDCSSLDHPKVHALAEALRCHEIAAFGAIVALRCRAMRHCPSGDVSAISERTLKLWLLGFPRVSWAAFVAAGVVDQDGERKTMHGWERYDDKEARRIANAERAKRWRDERARNAHANAFANAHVTHSRTRTERESNGAEGEGEGEKEEETVEAARAKSPRGKFGSERRADLAARWNALAETHGLPRVRPDDAPAWADKADARIAEGVLERWGEVAAGIAAVIAEPRHAAARPKWLKFAHLVANGTNWRKLAADGDRPEPVAPKRFGERLLEGVDLSRYCDPEPVAPQEPRP